MTFRAWAVDTGERALSTFVQGLIIYLPVILGSTFDATALQGLVAATIPAVLGILLNAITVWVPKPKSWRTDVFIRMLRTFAVGVLGVLTADGMDLLDASSWQTALIGGLYALATLIKGGLAKANTDTITPASFATNEAAGLAPAA